MSVATPPAPIPPAAALAQGAPLSPGDLAELLTAFNEVTSKLQATHETLRAEVARLERELRETNEALRRSERLAALGEMAAGIAHEIRNPLASIGLYARLLVGDLGDRPECREVAEKIARGVKGLDAIVGDVLTFAKRIEPRADECLASEALSKAAETCSPQLESSGATLDIRFASRAEDIGFAADAGLLQQALVNVVRNAAEALAEMPIERRPADPFVRLDAQRVRVRDRDGAKRMVALIIEDNGPGVPDQVKKRMFNPFFTTRHTGTGLGLAIVHRIVDAHGGRVRVRDRAGGGTVVEILLPERRDARNMQAVTTGEETQERVR